ncbi:enoyl-CoA hydratase-related protein [Aeromicrobium alkaliterrae]|uniref:Crotonase/enoyl-CoA hydratase family protein n=1 Tax=Aeromicrobium alkaliterrae TaxID=302168 RepID=A0ABN2JEN4_9ACTN
MSESLRLANLDYDVADHVATVRFNRPEKRNTFTKQMALDIVQAIAAADADDDVRVVVVAGSGGHFCAGADLEAAMSGELGGTDEFAEAAGDITGVERDSGGYAALAIAASLKPVIAAVSGSAVGIGATLTLPMDVRVVGESARYGFVFNRRALVPEAASTWFLPRVVAPGKALEWVLTGRLVGSAEALASGLANHVVADDEVETKAFEIAREIAENTSPVSVSLSRQMLWRGLEVDSPWHAHAAESRALAERFQSTDLVEGITSFFEKRTPSFPMGVPSQLPDTVERPAQRPSDV